MPLPRQPSSSNHSSRNCQTAQSFIRIDLKVACTCKCVGECGQWETFTRTGLRETRVKGEIKALLGCKPPLLTRMSLLWGWNCGEWYFYTHTADTSLLILALVLPKIAEITGITAFAALIHCRLKPLNNSASALHKHTHTHTHSLSLPWAPVCGLSGAADGWLIDWGGPLMISVANDLLNNSLGLLLGNRWKAKHIYGHVHWQTRTHLRAHAFILYTQYAYIQIFVDTHTHSPSVHTPGVRCLPVCCWHLGCFTSAPPLFSWYHHPAHSVSEQKESY